MRPSLADEYQALLKAQFALHAAPTPVPLTREAIQSLPAPVRRYIERSGALGRPIPWNVRVEFEAVMRRKPGDGGMRARSEQVNFFDPPSRNFFMRARMFGLPVRVLHRYADAEASMQVRVLGLFDVVDIRSHELFKAECVTVLNDLCCFAPGRLTDPRLAWKGLDERRAEVAFTNQGLTVRAVLHFNEAGDLVNFVSDDRYALQPDGSLKNFRFSTPLSGHRDFGGIRLGGHGDAIYDYPSGPFVYGNFDLKSVEYNVGFQDSADQAVTPSQASGAPAPPGPGH
jgi:hypothetical protein